MRLQPACLSLILTLATIQTMVAEPEATPNAPQTREEAIDNLLSERASPAAFKASIENARRAGVNDQVILEARFLYHVDMHEDDAIAALLPEFLKQNENFRITDSTIFAVKEDWLAVVEYVKAMAALQKGDKDAFKQHITEAFWLGPRQAAAFAPHIERLRQEEAMRAIKINFDTTLNQLSDGTPITLKTLLHEQKALLLHFWSPQSRECELSLPDFAKTCEMLTTQQIAIASITPKDSPEILKHARELAQPYASSKRGAWTTDNTEHSLAIELRVQNLPTMVIVSPDGSILFNGDPTDDQFWTALKKINPAITRPSLEGNYEE